MIDPDRLDSLFLDSDANRQEIGETLFALCRGVAHRYGSIDYDESVSAGFIRCWDKLHTFDPSKGAPAFNYFTQIAKHAMFQECRRTKNWWKYNPQPDTEDRSEL